MRGVAVPAVPGEARRRVRVRVSGTVQGVGFRPYVHRLAAELGLDGWVLNDDRGVLLEIEGPPPAVGRFAARLPVEAPPLAEVESVALEDVAATGQPGFAIAASERRGRPLALVSADWAPCDACLRELLDPRDRRYRYPFLNCTDCGPRFTIVRGVPYDRPLTTMAGFVMCAACRAEYEDPGDRRFHAQPTACPVCGPSLALLDAAGTPCDGDALRGAVEGLDGGLVVAIKGLGGYHLACRADDERAVGALRAGKHREDKPFALMAADLQAARELVALTPAEEELLLSRRRPIVIARRRPEAAVAPSVAPGSPDLGVMLPSTPLHHLLLADAGTTLVMTSGNVSDEPIAYRDDDALGRLAGIADRFLVHDRPIEIRTDDSVLRSLGALRSEPLMVRRARGYVPESIGLPVAAARPLLGCGAELKSTFCLAKGDRAWVGHHIGDLKNWETLRSFREGIGHFEQLFAVAPEVVAHDLHPDYLSTAYAEERADAELVGVQHHHAHLAACLAEHGEEGPAVGAIYDGAGLGTDGTVWGGEILVGDLIGFDRAGCLLPVRLPGGDRAVDEPWRMACSWLVAAGVERLPVPAALAGKVDARRWEQVAELCVSALASPLTSSVGRLFDAIGALCGLRATVNYEGQAAVVLEAAATSGERGASRSGAGASAYGLPLVSPPAAASPAAATPAAAAPSADPPAFVIDARETVAAVARDAAAGVPVTAIASRFHAAVAAATVAGCERAAHSADVDLVVLSGGVFQNRLLLELTVAGLEARGLQALVPRRLPPNDGGISYGQAAVAAARMTSRPAY